MTATDPSLRVRFWASLLLFVSAYSPLLLILIIKDYDPHNLSWLPRHPVACLILLVVAGVSSVVVLAAARGVRSGLEVKVLKASNKSGEMFGYSIPYMLSVFRIELTDWQTVASLLVFLAMLFVIAYRTQSVFVNPILALAGYLLIDCAFERDGKESQAMVITRAPLGIGDSVTLERLSHYLFIAARREPG